MITLIENINKLNEAFELILQNEAHLYRTEIDCSKLAEPKYEMRFAEYDIQLQRIKEDLKEYNNPCLYWFSTETTEKASDLIEQLNLYRADKYTIKRKVPVKNNNCNSTIIYVGKSTAGKRKIDNQTKITGRIATHFGYSKHASTQGLQLQYWTKEKITVNILELPSELSDYLEVLEKLLAKKLSPLCGRH
jgi:hypothetical protein